MLKKLLPLIVLAVFGVTSANAQQGNSAEMMARMKERIKPQLTETAKINDSQADKVIEYNFEMRRQLRTMRMDGMNEADMKKKSDEMQTELNKKYKDLALTDEQVSNVNKYFAEMQRNRPAGANRN